MADNAPKGPYIVFKGTKPGIYDTWAECEAQVHQSTAHIQGGFADRSAAEAAWQKHITEIETAALSIPSILEEFRRLCGMAQKNLFSGQDISGDNLKRPCSPADEHNNGQQSPKRIKVGPVVVEEDVVDTEPEQASEAEAEKIELTTAQNAVLEMALKRDNIFLTGAAGSGKTVTLKKIIESLTQRYTKFDQVQVVAPTGIAALPLDGKTTYSFAGWRPDSLKKPMEELLESIKPYVTKSIKMLEVLIIEEISMVENQFLERLNLLLQKVLKSRKPFGGVQVIFVGDFHQLPPVNPFETCLDCGKEMSSETWKYGRTCNQKGCKQKGKKTFRYEDKWAFKAHVWSKLRLKHVKLEEIHRQKEGRFQNILNKIADGTLLTNDEWGILEAEKRLPTNAFAVRLMSKRKKVESFNKNELKNICSEPHSWTAYDFAYKLHSDPADRNRPHSGGSTDPANEIKQSLRDEHRYQTDLTLKVGAKVVLLCNLDFRAGLVNGSQGQVVMFERAGSGSGEMSKRRPWEKRCRNFEDMNHSLKPVVRFENGKVRTIEPDTKETTKTIPAGQFLVSRTQIPLTLAWALSIHKSQGMTLQHVNVSMSDIFETGQLYVGLSRATTLDGLTVTGSSREQLVMDKDVLAFYKNTKWESLSSADPPNSSSKIPERPITSESSSDPPDEPMRQRSPENVCSVDKTKDQSAPETARSFPESSDKNTDRRPLEKAVTVPKPPDMPGRSSQKEHSSPKLSENTRNQGPEDEYRTPPNQSTPQGPRENLSSSTPLSPENTSSQTSSKKTFSAPALLDETIGQRPSAKTCPASRSSNERQPERNCPFPNETTPQHSLQRNHSSSQRPPKQRLFKVTKPMTANTKPSIERRELLISSPLNQRKPVIIDLVSSDDEG